MNGIAFGKYLKGLRNKANKPSKELSAEVGKAVTYVSQLERGLIKKPDFQTSYKLLSILGIEEDKIEGILDYYGIVSPQREQAELEWASKKAEEMASFDWLEQETSKLKQTNNLLYKSLEFLIDKDITRAEKLINNLHALTTDRDKFDFLSLLFEYPYSNMSNEDRQELIKLTHDFIKSKYNYDEYGDFIKKEDK